jgi:hypothetical protein
VYGIFSNTGGLSFISDIVTSTRTVLFRGPYNPPSVAITTNENSSLFSRSKRLEKDARNLSYLIIAAWLA